MKSAKIVFGILAGAAVLLTGWGERHDEKPFHVSMYSAIYEAGFAHARHESAELIYLAQIMGEDLWLEGIWVNGKWLLPEEARRYLPRNPQTWAVYNWKGKVGQISSVGMIEETGEGGCPCGGPHFFLKVLKVSRKIEYDIAVAGTNKTKAVTMKRLSTTNPTYISLVREFLKRKKVTVNKPRIRELYVQDINGDGKFEAIVVANSQTAPLPTRTRPDDYGVVLFRFIDRQGKLQEEPLMFYKYEGPYIGVPEAYSVKAVLDIQGDGKVEIIVAWEYYEGDGMTVFEFDGQKIKKVLSFGCGA